MVKFRGYNPSFINSVNFALVISLGIGVSGVVCAQPKPADPVKLNVDSSRLNTLDSSVFSLTGAERLVTEAMDAAAKQNYDAAATKLQDARQIFNQLSNFYQDLNGSFTGLDNRIADTQRQKALQAAQLRDKSTYQLALVYRARNQPELAIPLLVQLVRSQQPSRDLGKLAYQQLLELGFVDEAYPRPTTSTVTPPKP